MTVSVRTLDRPEILEIHFQGSFEDNDSEQFDQLLTSKLIEPKMRLLLRLEDFDGWDTMAGIWKSLGLVRHHRDQVERIAAVADKTWKEAVVVLAGPFAHAETKTFAQDELAEARTWLHEEKGSG